MPWVFKDVVFVFSIVLKVTDYVVVIGTLKDIFAYFFITHPFECRYDTRYRHIRSGRRLDVPKPLLGRRSSTALRCAPDGRAHPKGVRYLDVPKIIKRRYRSDILIFNKEYNVYVIWHYYIFINLNIFNVFGG